MRRINKGFIIFIAAFVIVAIFLTTFFSWFAKLDLNPDTNNAKDTEKASYPTPIKQIPDIETNGIQITSRVNEQYFYLKSNDSWNCTFLKGVNMGLTLPDTNLNNPDIPYDTYLEWFSSISKMNANTVKTFTVMNPDFYRAFYDYNREHSDDPLYLLQGMWINENDMYEISDAYGNDGSILENFKKTAKETCDIINGNSDYTSYGNISPAIYDKDISKYVIGYILGLEWSPNFIINTNENNSDRSEYIGDYLKTESASPFEAFLCEIGDFLIDYETNTYSRQSPIAFLNWSTTDPMSHSNEPFPEEDAVSLDTENIISTDKYYPGLFAAIDVYPYYPEFMNYQKEYIEYTSSSGNKDPYRAYLADLIGSYSVPVIIAEFGIPTSRGIAHTSAMGYNQGGVDEARQGQYIAQMVRSIAKEKYAGAMIFSWQDEWFKQTWNTVKFAPENAKNRTPNVQSAEQSYGILAYSPGETGAVCYPDGDLSEWEKETPVYNSQGLSIYLKADTAYLYIMGKAPINTNLNKERLAIALQTTDTGSSFAKDYNLTFDKPVDFFMVLDGQNNSKILTDSYYDLFYFQYSILKQIFPRNDALEIKNTGVFSKINTFYSNEITLPEDGTYIPPRYYESGMLKYGNANPSAADYDSLADFYFNENSFEIRIPWYLLNVMNINEGIQLGDFYQTGDITFKKMDNTISVGGAVLSSESLNIKLNDFNLTDKVAKGYHSRLKKSYQIIANEFKSLMKEYS